jgi:acyl-CoA synthetase (AMP-forming)/AMP-acid ligase II
MTLSARTTPELVRAAAERFGERIALEEDGRSLTFKALADVALRATRAFCQAGVARGDRVAIWAPNCGEWIVLALGLQGAGAVLVPLNTRLKGQEAGYILRKSGARILCTSAGFLNTDYVGSLAGEALPALQTTVMLRGSAPGGQSFDDFLAAGAAFPEAEARRRSETVSPDDLSDMIFTSGTTGNPKGVLTTHGQNLRVYASWSDCVGLREGDRYLIVNPFFHCFGYKAGWLSCILRGATILPHAFFDVPTILQRVSAERISVLPGTPTVYQSILVHPDRHRFDLSTLRLAVTGAATVPVELIRRMREELRLETVITGYGLTETCGTVSMCRQEDSVETIANTAGRALPGVELRCVMADGTDAKAGEPGELWVRGYNVMQGYFDDEAETRATLDAGGWLHTGDIAVVDASGYVRITDRIKDMFISGGFNCYPAEIEKIMFEHPDIAQVAVIGVADLRMGEVGMAFVVPTPGSTLRPEAVIAWSREHMANYKVPRRVELLNELPLNASGKVTKFVLRERAKAQL